MRTEEANYHEDKTKSLSLISSKYKLFASSSIIVKDKFKGRQKKNLKKNI